MNVISWIKSAKRIGKLHKPDVPSQDEIHFQNRQYLADRELFDERSWLVQWRVVSQALLTHLKGDSIRGFDYKRFQVAGHCVARLFLLYPRFLDELMDK